MTLFLCRKRAKGSEKIIFEEFKERMETRQFGKTDMNWYKVRPCRYSVRILLLFYDL